MHIGIASMCTNNMLLKLRKPILKYRTLLKQVSCPLAFLFLNISICLSVLKYLSLYGKLFIFTWQLYHQIWFHELCWWLPGCNTFSIHLFQKYFGRRRNCYTITIKITQRAHRYSTQHRVLRVKKMQRVGWYFSGLQIRVCNRKLFFLYI